MQMISDDEAKARKKLLNSTPEALAARVFKRRWKSAALRGEITPTGCVRCPQDSNIRSYAVKHISGDILQTTWMCKTHKKIQDNETKRALEWSASESLMDDFGIEE